MKRLLPFFLLSIFLFGCNSKSAKDTELNNLVNLVLGEFSNEEQAKNDASYAHLNLVNARIWKDKPGYWVYSEVSDAKQDLYIYSQRIVNYKRLDSTSFISTSYIIDGAKDFESGWKDPNIFDELTMDDIEMRRGCEVYYKKKTSTIFSGKTDKGSCISSIKGIDYITSAFVVSKDKISVWTRGYDQKGKQVWGKIKGPFKYKKQ
ncbi:chromophore lyase CpcT/CpeT [Aquimarina gracilis]|uniref:Chromophore lyase CpcT/CpeT n=1 Tax=Aquimarina gracilis TaxID=874422 RepID=A0ABU5ZRZ0_9FLAO|nr:chromophore lyase CpcT/CpeT [Aquimarina gracilis]MEB3344846.1 chromophore lyase CpcT/CpeT [Aquimarina gracilis]